MSAYAMKPDYADPLLSNDVLAHLDAQIASAARLLEIVMAQHDAINLRDVDAVVREVSAFQAEFQRRARVEDERTRLLNRAAAALGLSPGEVTVTRMTLLMPPHLAQQAQTRSAELQRLLTELTRQHTLNQSLMRQELAFLDHLLNIVEPVSSLGYEPGGTLNSMPVAPLPGQHALDLHA
ncbi:flagellar export chaperone FlgN [Conexibacter sp. CPCC 206217]|uniref:flagellar export chaperone FlgN n=1 Tax=Conexibacter sp. CPCC 206217 TaxID=3064574 RepID=UPI00271A3456|nr:flagellar export chaperone FlgN [Conexibacter sp. CPCC 206217]MDO8211437.1 flagellar export chaperone FlgN [Conexibacter sp. CPCC 206217]